LTIWTASLKVDGSGAVGPLATLAMSFPTTSDRYNPIVLATFPDWRSVNIL